MVTEETEGSMKSLEGEFSQYIVAKNRPRPVYKTWAKVADKWDRLVTKLEIGDEIWMNKTEANSFTNRAKKAGFVVVSRKRELTAEQIRNDEPEFLVWFGGTKR